MKTYINSLLVLCGCIILPCCSLNQPNSVDSDDGYLVEVITKNNKNSVYYVENNKVLNKTVFSGKGSLSVDFLPSSDLFTAKIGNKAALCDKRGNKIISEKKGYSDIMESNGHIYAYSEKKNKYFFFDSEYNVISSLDAQKYNISEILYILDSDLIITDNYGIISLMNRNSGDIIDTYEECSVDHGIVALTKDNKTTSDLLNGNGEFVAKGVKELAMFSKYHFVAKNADGEVCLMRYSDNSIVDRNLDPGYSYDYRCTNTIRNGYISYYKNGRRVMLDKPNAQSVFGQIDDIFDNGNVFIYDKRNFIIKGTLYSPDLTTVLARDLILDGRFEGSPYYVVRNTEIESFGISGVMDCDGKIIIPCQYIYVEPFMMDGNYYFRVKSQNEGVPYTLDVNNRKVSLNMEFDNDGRRFLDEDNDGIIAKTNYYGQNSSMEIINYKTGNTLFLENPQSKAKGVLLGNGVFSIGTDNGFTLYDENGEQISEYEQYCKIWHYHHGITKVSQKYEGDDKYGIIDGQGKTIIPAKYVYICLEYPFIFAADSKAQNLFTIDGQLLISGRSVTLLNGKEGPSLEHS